LLPLPTSLCLPIGSWAQDPGFQLQVQELVRVQEGLCVVVPCSISYPAIGWVSSTPAYGFWFKDQTATDSGLPVATNKPGQDVQTHTEGRFQLLGNVRQNCSLLIRNVRMEDSALYFFRLERGRYVRYNFMEYKFRLEVTALTQKPEIYIPETLKPGHQVTLICMFDWPFEECPAPTLSWRGAAVSAHEARPRASYLLALTFTPRPQDHGTKLTCRVDVSRKGLSTENTVLLSVAYAPKDLVISISQTDVSGTEGHLGVPHLEVQKGQFLRLLCTADSMPLATLSWALQDRILSWSHPSGSRTLELVLPRVKAEDAGRYTCRAENGLGSQSRSLELFVQCKCDQQGPGLGGGRGAGRREGAEGRVPELYGDLEPQAYGARDSASSSDCGARGGGGGGYPHATKQFSNISGMCYDSTQF
uniref:Ig-like domain-containing protein n=1 Tax=Balaenoptera musculus TaxID=9771 RepID=A0A8C0DGC2_BALMU